MIARIGATRQKYNRSTAVLAGVCRALCFSATPRIDNGALLRSGEDPSRKRELITQLDEERHKRAPRSCCPDGTAFSFARPRGL